MNVNFRNNKLPKEGSQCIYLSVILIDSVYRKDENYYPQVFQKNVKYIFKERKMSKSIADGIEISSDESDEES